MNSIIIFVVIGSVIAVIITTISFFSIFNVVQIFGDQQLLEEQQQEGNNRTTTTTTTANIDQQLQSLDLTIQEGLTECYDLKSDNCIAVMNVLDNVCQSIYSEYCFGPIWDKFVEYKQELINEGHLPEYEDDSYYNLNNDHYGNSLMKGNNSNSRDLK